MAISLDDRRTDNLIHAQWRVKFRQSLLDMHRATTRNGSEWVAKEAEYVRWLQEAKSELAQLERGVVTRVFERAS